MTPMTDEEYHEYLTALAKRHMNLGWLHNAGPNMQVMGHDIERLSSSCRFLWAVYDRPDNQVLTIELAKELRGLHLEHVFSEMDRSGVLSALDAAPEITFGELRRSAIPLEDAQLLARAGVNEADAEITIIIQHARRHLGHPEAMPSRIVHEAQTELRRAADRLQQVAPPASENIPQAATKRRKLFGGIGKLLGGTITAAGNLLLATGTLMAPNPATAYLAIGSSALAVGSIGEGIELLRGE